MTLVGGGSGSTERASSSVSRPEKAAVQRAMQRPRCVQVDGRSRRRARWRGSRPSKRTNVKVALQLHGARLCTLSACARCADFGATLRSSSLLRVGFLRGSDDGQEQDDVQTESAACTSGYPGRRVNSRRSRAEDERRLSAGIMSGCTRGSLRIPTIPPECGSSMRTRRRRPRQGSRSRRL